MIPRDKAERDNPPETIYVDSDGKRCEKKTGARRATYNKEYEVYVIDH